VILLVAAAAVCPLWADVKKSLPDNVRWQTMTRRQTVFLEGIWAMNPTTPPGLPDGSVAYLGTVEGKKGGMVVFARDDYSVCSQPMAAPPALGELLKKLEGQQGDDM